MRILYPESHAGRTGIIQVPLWTFEEGDRRIGVLVDGGGMEWVTAVEVTRTFGVNVGSKWSDTSQFPSADDD